MRKGNTYISPGRHVMIKMIFCFKVQEGDPLGARRSPSHLGGTPADEIDRGLGILEAGVPGDSFMASIPSNGHPIRL
jgi:hypothetical protein